MIPVGYPVCQIAYVEPQADMMLGMKQNVLVIGSGGREHALAWKIAQSPQLGELYVAPGNGGTAAIATNVPVKASDIDGLVAFAREHEVHLAVVGPDDALAGGVVDAFEEAGLRIYGPTKAAAQIEASKAFSKDLMTKTHVPTARYATFTDLTAAKDYVHSHPFPAVVKASGLALGKGVYICADLEEAHHALDEIMGDKLFGDAGNSVVIEEYLDGQEVSIHAFCDGHTAVLFPPAQDHKRIGTGDVGPNTGGMGTFAPVPWVTTALMHQVQKQAVQPILTGLREHHAKFIGTLYPGLMVDGDQIRVLEYNARFGDPEMQTYMALLETDLLEVLNACIDGHLADLQIKWSDKTAVTVVLAAGGYPGKYAKGLPISGLSTAAALPDVVVFHAGTRREGDQVLTTGGRVLGVTATGTDLRDAQARAYRAVSLIKFEGMQYRTDIGSKAL
jgi:phosphoribosylamine--glycine ligase